MNKLIITTLMICSTLSAFAVTSEDHFVLSNNFLKPLVGNHSLSGDSGCENIRVKFISENDRFNHHVGRRTFSIQINDFNLHPATQGDDKHFKVTTNEIINNRNWLMITGLKSEKVSYKIKKDQTGNLTNFEHTIYRRKGIFGKIKVFTHLECHL